MIVYKVANLIFNKKQNANIEYDPIIKNLTLSILTHIYMYIFTESVCETGPKDEETGGRARGGFAPCLALGQKFLFCRMCHCDTL